MPSALLARIPVQVLYEQDPGYCQGDACDDLRDI